MSIICGTDLSPASLGALEVAVALAKLDGDREVVLVHVAPENVTPPTLATVQHDVEAMARVHGDAECGIRPVVLTGDPARMLVDLATRERSELIVVAAGGTQTRGDDARLGNIASQIVERAHVPVIGVRDPAPWLAFARKQRPLRLLLGIDESAVCDLSIQWTHRLAALAPLKIVLGAIYYPDDAADHYGLHRSGMVDRQPEIERVIARDLLRRFGGSLETVTARPRRGLGRLGDHVLELAREEAVDVIVVGTNQKTGLGRLGSVSSVVVHNAQQSVVCIPPHAEIATVTLPVLRAALVATDLSQFSNRAVPYAFAACEPDAEIHLIHVVDEDAEVDLPAIEVQLAALAPRAATQKLLPQVVRGDDPAKAIAQAAARLGVDVICICSHGRSGITRALVGSVADRLLRVTRLPVLVLRPA